MFEVGNIVKWTDERREKTIPFHRDFRFEITAIGNGKITIKALSDKWLITRLTDPEGIVRDIEYERQLKMSKFIKKKKWWHIFKKR